MDIQPYGVDVYARGEFSITWPRMKPGMTGQPYETDGRQIHSIDVGGTFSNKVEIMLLGSDDGRDWSPMADDVGRIIEVHNAGSLYVGTTPRFVRPVVSSVDGSSGVPAGMSPHSAAVAVEIKMHVRAIKNVANA